MSMIDVQSTRAGSDKPVPPPHKGLQSSGHEKPSSTALTFGLLMMSLGLYLKSSFLGDATANVPQDGPAPEDVPAPVHDDALVSVASLADLREILRQDDEAPEALDDFHPVKAFTRIFYNPYEVWEPRDFFLQTPFIAVGSAAASEPGQMPRFTLPDGASVANDNSHHPASAGGGGEAPPKQDGGSQPGTGGNSPGGGGGASNGAGNGNGNNGNNGGEQPRANRRPQVSGAVTLYDAYSCMAVLIALSDLLRNASDPDGDTLSIRNIHSSEGVVSPDGSGYRLISHHAGPVTLSYEISDGHLSVEQTATINILKKPPIVGTDHGDVLQGTGCEDEILGKDGDDRIDAREGDDVVSGGAGSDHIVGGSGNDIIFGDDGDDIIFGNDGDDVVEGGNGDDRIFGGSGNDVLLGDAGNDLIFGDGGNDVISGGAGNDIIHDGGDTDVINGDEGDDTVVATADSSSDAFIGGAGIDTADFSQSASNLVFNMQDNLVSGADVGDNSVAEFEVFIGGSGDDLFKLAAISGASADPAMSSDDSLPSAACETPDSDGEACDSLPVGVSPVAISFIGSEGFDTLDISAAAAPVMIDTTSGIATGSDIATMAFSNVEKIVGGASDDTFLIGEGAITLDGRAGNDLFEFLVDATVERSTSHHAIDNFEVGDVIRMSRYDIFEHVVDAVENVFQDVYGNQSNEDGNAPDAVIPIRIRNEIYDDGSQKSFVDADFDNDQQFEISIELNGSHHLSYTMNQVG